MTKDEALKMAIEYIEKSQYEKHDEVINACKEALEQPAQNLKLIEDNGNGIKTYEILPTHQWQGLTDDEIEEITGEDIRSMYSGTYNAYRDIEQALKEKNA